MKLISLRHYSVTSLMLFTASTIIATIMPKNSLEKLNNGGTLVLSSDGVEQTCKFTVKVVNECTYTQTLPPNQGHYCKGSRTSSENGIGQNDSSSITTCNGIDSIKTYTEDENNNIVHNLHTSADNN